MSLAPPPGTRVAIVDDEPEFRRSVELLLRGAGLLVQGYRSAQEYLDRPPDPPVDCVLLDLEMPGPSGLELQAHLARQDASPPVVFLSGSADVPRSVHAMREGAVDFLTKPFDRDTLLRALARAVGRSREERAAREVRERARARLAALTPRERQIAELVVGGQGNKEIGALLGISEQMVKVHRQNAMHKLGVATPLELLRLLEAAVEPRRSGEPARGRS